MRILTISASPYLLTKLGRLHSDVILNFYKQHTLYSAVWDHDLKWFSPDEQGHYFYEKNGEKICQLLPYISQNPQISSPQLYEIFQKVKPELVISIGDYNEVDAIFAIKTLNSTKFKWVHVLTLNAGPIKDTFNDVFNYIDYVVHTNKKSKKMVSKLSPVANSFSYVGIDESVFFYKNNINNEKLNIISCAKNSQASGIGSILSSSQFLNKDFNLYLHTNLYDTGDYDLNLLKNRYDANEIVRFPENFVGLNDGTPDNELNDLYNDSDVFIDVSVRSATAIALIESMAAGCIPVVAPIGALKEIVDLLPEDCRFFVDGNLYIGSLEEEYYIVSPEHLSKIIQKIYNIKKHNKGKFLEMKNNIVSVVKTLKRKDFLKKIEEAIDFVKKENSVIVESF